MFERENWATRMGFILAAVGSAVGLGNIWRFPFQVGQEGGAAFLLIYLLFIFAIGFPAMLVEFVIGRRSQRNPINAFEELGYKKWMFAGAIGVVTAFVILAFYSVVGGWVFRYAGASLTGAYFADPTAYFNSIAMGYDALAFHAVFMLLTGGIVFFGIKRGIEIAVKLMVPAIVVLLIFLGIYALTLEGAMDGISWYLEPDFAVLAENWTSILPAAAGQAFFTLSLGMGAMITYSSYLGEDKNLGKDGASIVGLDTLIAIMTGFVVFPILFTIGVSPGEGGAGELFVGLGGAIAELPGIAAEVVGFLFFFTVLIAALSSAISILEVVVSFIVDNFRIDRKIAASAVSLAIFLTGVPVALDLYWLDIYDHLTAYILLPLGMFFLVVFVGWIYEEAEEELAKGVGNRSLIRAWLWHVRIPILIIIGIVLLLNFDWYLAEYAGVSYIDWITGLF
ncbi:Na+-dependent transporter of the SNF family [Methanonatronarchaeum thermophilum]|uniref:Na+-dependent transporter of the SNF family n=1 Tax=Methanonatronarchaeum thermophilum TaxID=1927129 RepID=A0A1Y3GFR4_9EURY|nr:sodium-dependent transporter [Methanonatronarchaeum thermophilum]OUJ18216.1 Na+-dependent transporter of the SNF family [Methanonatronarchaeum thermophilum]